MHLFASFRPQPLSPRTTSRSDPLARSGRSDAIFRKHRPLRPCSASGRHPVGPGAVMDALAAMPRRASARARISIGRCTRVGEAPRALGSSFDQAFSHLLPPPRHARQVLAAMLPQAPPGEDEKAPPGAQRSRRRCSRASARPSAKPPQLESMRVFTVSTARCCKRGISRK